LYTLYASLVLITVGLLAQSAHEWCLYHSFDRFVLSFA
jgi:hypothetical protein